MAQLHRQSWNGDLSVVIEEEEESRDLFIPFNEQIVEKVEHRSALEMYYLSL